MEELIMSVYDALGVIENELSSMIAEERIKDKERCRKLMDLSVGILDIRWSIMTSLYDEKGRET